MVDWAWKGALRMGKKTYHLVDPDTREVVGETRIGALTRLSYFSATARGKAAKWAALGVLLFLCLMLSALEPSLPALPAWVFQLARGALFGVQVFVVFILPLRVITRLRNRAQTPPPDDRPFLLIVDPDTGQVVDKQHAPEQDTRDSTPLEKVAFALSLIMVVQLLVIFPVCTVLYYFVSEALEEILFRVECVNAAVLLVVLLLLRILDGLQEDQKDNEGKKDL